jgi:hypothetical protein
MSMYKVIIVSLNLFYLILYITHNNYYATVLESHNFENMYKFLFIIFFHISNTKNVNFVLNICERPNCSRQNRSLI